MAEKKIDTGILILVYGWLFLISAGFGGYGLYELGELRMGQESLNWRKTAGTITSSFMVRGSREGSSSTLPTPFRGDRPVGTRSSAGRPTRSLRLTYTYMVNGESYTGKRIRFGTMSPDPDQMIKRYPKGRAVTVYYNPNTPENSVLLPGVTRSMTRVLIVCGSVILLCILGAILFRVFTVRYSRTPQTRKKPGRKIPHQQKQQATFTIYMGGVSLLLCPFPVLGWIIIVFTIAYGFLNIDSIKEIEYRTGKILTISGISLGFLAAFLKLVLKKYL